MKKFICLIFITILSLSAQESRENIYNNIFLSENSETKATIRQYINSAYNISAYKANYFLPISYRIDNNYPRIVDHNYDNPPMQTEVEFQISIKYDIASNLFNLDEIYTVAYTQKSFWQFYAASAYFRETNYNPEFFITFPIKFGQDKYGVRAIKAGFAHESNGQGLVYERSWNYFYSDIYFQLGFVFVNLELWYAPKNSLQHNTDLLDYLGYGHVIFVVPYEKHLLKTKIRPSFKNYGALELNYSYPVPLRDDLFFYIKAFDGYGESLIDYNQKVRKIGIGFSISR